MTVNVFEDLDREPGQPRLSDLWEWARDDYKAGESADVVCERHKLSRSQFFERARREGWLRRDQPRRGGGEPTYDAEVEAAMVEHALDQPPTPAYALHRRAWARMERALIAGRRVEAQGWARLARDLRKLSLEEERTIYWHEVVKRHETPKPDSADSPIPPPFTGEVAAEGRRRGPRERDVQAGGDFARDADDEGSGACVAPSVASPSEPRHLPRCAGEEQGPDSADSSAKAAPLNRAERRLAAKLSRSGLARAGADARSEVAWPRPSR